MEDSYGRLHMNIDVREIKQVVNILHIYRRGSTTAGMFSSMHRSLMHKGIGFYRRNFTCIISFSVRRYWGNLLLGCLDLVLWAETLVSEGPDACGFMEIGLRFLMNTSISSGSPYCTPLLAFHGILLERICGFLVCDWV